MSTVDLSGVAWRKSSRSGQGDNGNCVEVGFVNWRKSSRSGQGGNGNCVEVGFMDWHKSSSSGNGDNGACVEVGFGGSGVAVRDSKNPAAGAIVLPAAGWHGFLRHLAAR